MIKLLRDTNDVRSFFDELIGEGTIIHPDDDFRNIIKRGSGKKTYSVKEAEVRNQLMKKSFRICNKENVCIYDLAASVTLERTGLDELIPMPETQFIS